MCCCTFFYKAETWLHFQVTHKVWGASLQMVTGYKEEGRGVSGVAVRPPQNALTPWLNTWQVCGMGNVGFQEDPQTAPHKTAASDLASDEYWQHLTSTPVSLSETTALHRGHETIQARAATVGSPASSLKLPLTEQTQKPQVSG